MVRHALGLVALGALSLVAGCPSAITLELDAAGSDAASAVDAAAHSAWDACTATSECTLASAGCCEPCGTPVASDYDGVSTTHLDEHFAQVCPAPMPCPRCATGHDPSLVATCASSHCEVVDLSLLPLSACTADADCVVRWANCCSCSGMPTEVVSVRSDAEAAVEAILCDGGGCAADCAAHGDPGFRAVCDTTTGHCAAVPVGIGP